MCEVENESLAPPLPYPEGDKIVLSGGSGARAEIKVVDGAIVSITIAN